MSADFIPQSYKNLKDWLHKQNITSAMGTSMGMSDDEVTAYTAACSTLATAVGEIVDLMEQLEEKTADFPVIRDAQFEIIRATIKRAKTSPGCTPAMQTALDWIGQAHNTDPDTARPLIKVEAQRGRVKVDGRKLGFEAVNIYARKKGDVQWKLTAVRKRKFPYFDETPLAVAGQPEVREYMAIGTLADEETGQPSEIKEVVFAG